MQRLRFISLVVVILAFAGCAPTVPRMGSVVATGNGEQACGAAGTAYMRTTLYFGLTHPTGMISEAEWQAFLRDEVTPRFPDGLTVVEADGQWRRPDGSIGRERTKVLLIVHDEKPKTRAALEAIVTRYKKTFTQESVLWETARVCAAF